MVANAAIRTLVRENKMHQALSVIEASRSEGMQTIDAALAALVKRGLVERDEAIRHARNAKTITE
jgi:twitching motility protein PilT